MLQRVSASDADYILMSFEGMKEIPLRKASEYIQDDIHRYEDRWRAAVRDNNRRAAKDLEKKLARLADKLAKMQDMKKTSTIWFEDLGVDGIFVDELQNHKNVPRMYGDMVEYMRDPDFSERAADMVYKSRYIHERRGGRKGQNFFGLSATPTPNHPTEIYAMMQYVAPDEWTSRGIENAGDFIEQFCDIGTMEIKESTGVASTRTKITGYKNMSELRQIYRRYIDYRLPSSLGIPAPKAEYNDVILEPTEAVMECAGYIASLEEWFKTNPASAMLEKIIPITILKRAQKLAADPAILNPQQYEGIFGQPGSKIDAVLKSVLKLDKGDNAQLIFCDLYRGGYLQADDPKGDEGADMGADQSEADQEQHHEKFVEVVNIHNWFKQKLMEHGVPESQIAIINGEINATPAAKFKIQQDAAEGKIRFLIGSTASMGEGMNLQVHTTDGHMVDVPWTPAAMEQRGGRFIRQGNLNDQVTVHRYLVKGTADAKMYDTLAQKEAWNQDLWLGTEDTILDFDEDGRNYQDLSDAVSIPQSTLDYYRARRVLIELDQETKQAQPKLNQLQERLRDRQEDIGHRERQIEHYQKIIDRGDGSDWHRRTIESHHEHVAQLQSDVVALEAEINQLTQGMADRTARAQSAREYISLYEEAKKLGKTVEELEQERGITNNLSGGMGRNFSSAPIATDIPDEVPPEDLGPDVADKAAAGLPPSMPSPPGEPDVAEKRASVPAFAREAEPGPAYVLTMNVDPADLKMLTDGKIPTIISERLQQESLTLDPSATAAKVAHGWQITSGSRILTLQSYESGIVDIFEQSAVGRVEIPELMNWVEDALARPAMLNPRLRTSFGRFIGEGTGRVELRTDLFQAKNREALARFLAHEIGHMVDWLPEQTLKRGNMLGRLMSLHLYLRKTYPGIKFKEDVFRKELIKLSEYWDPYDPNADARFTSYRRRPRELYADFISALLNNPGKTQELAPKFYREFYAHLDEKPDIKEALLKLQMAMQGSSEEALDDRLSRTSAMFNKAEDASLAVELEGRSLRRSLFGKLKDWFDGRYWRIESRTAQLESQGASLSEATNPRLLFDELSYKVHTDNFMHADRVEREVMQGILIPANITPEDMLWDQAQTYYADGKQENWGVHTALGIYMFLHRSATQRAEVANPKVVGGSYAAETLDRLRERIGEDKYNALEQAAHKYADIRWESWVNEAFELGGYPERAREHFLANKYNYAKFVPLEYISQYVSPRIKGQSGFSGAIENPFISTLKMDSAGIQWVAVLRARKAFIKTWLKNFRDECIPAEPISREGVPAYDNKPGFDIVEDMVDGKTRAYYVDEYLADEINKRNPESLAHYANWLLHFHNAWWKVVILYNLGFGAWSNIGRDFMTNYGKLPLEKSILFGDLWQLAKAYAKAAPHAWRWSRTADDPLVMNMIKGYEWSVPLVNAVTAEEDAYHYQLQRAGVLRVDGTIDRSKIVQLGRGIERLLYPLAFVTEFGDLLGKVAGHNIRVGAGQTGKELAWNVRRNTGTPAWYRRGDFTRVSNVLLPFSNMFYQGWKSTIEVATDPKTRGGYWWRTMKVLSLKLAMAYVFKSLALLTMLFGKEMAEKLHEAWGKITPYMHANYFIHLIGIGKDNQPVYMTFPLAEDQRVMSGVMLGTLDAMQRDDPERYSDIFKFIASQLPSANPLYQIASAWTEYYAFGINPTDNYRMLPLLPDRVAKAGGAPAFNTMMKFTLNNLGFSFQTYDDRKKNWYQNFVQYTPIIGNLMGRMIRYGGTGDLIQERREAATLAQQQALIATEKRDTSKAVSQFYSIQSGVLRADHLLNNYTKQGYTRSQALAKYPDARFADKFASTARILNMREKQIQEIKAGKDPADIKDAKISGIQKAMDTLARTTVDFYNLGGDESRRLMALPSFLPEPPESVK
jgi:hypothetical protein